MYRGLIPDCGALPNFFRGMGARINSKAKKSGHAPSSGSEKWCHFATTSRSFIVVVQSPHLYRSGGNNVSPLHCGGAVSAPLLKRWTEMGRQIYRGFQQSGRTPQLSGVKFFGRQLDILLPMARHHCRPFSVYCCVAESQCLENSNTTGHLGQNSEDSKEAFRTLTT